MMVKTKKKTKKTKKPVVERPKWEGLTFRQFVESKGYTWKSVDGPGSSLELYNKMFKEYWEMRTPNDLQSTV